MSLYRRALSTTEPSTPSGVVIRTPDQAASHFAGGGSIMMFGDLHNGGREYAVMARLVPVIAATGSRTLATELAPSLNPFLNRLQADIVQKNLSARDVRKRFSDELTRTDHPLSPDQVAGFSDILMAASKHGISVKGVDPRSDDPNFIQQLQRAEQAGVSPTKLDSLIYSQDQNIAQNVAALQQQDPSGRVALLFGVAHSFENEPQPRVITHLKNQGLSVTPISLNPTADIPRDLGTHPPSTSFAPLDFLSASPSAMVAPPASTMRPPVPLAP